VPQNDRLSSDQLSSDRLSQAGQDEIVFEGVTLPDLPPRRSEPPAVTCRHLTKIYVASSGRVLAVRGIDLEVEAGVTTAVVGPSGSGKSSLLRMLAALEPPTAGSVEIAGEDLFSVSTRQRAQRRGALLTHVYQRPGDNLIAHLTARQQLRRLVDADVDSGGDLAGDTIADTLSTLGLAHRIDHRPIEMSSGEQQRLALARAAVAGHRLVIADEPTAQLDAGNTRAVIETMEHLADKGVTVIVATHDQRVLPHVRQVVTLRDGAVASVTTDGERLAVIDRSGRLQLPPEAIERFSSRRALVEFDAENDEVRIRRP
jgi:putative ABC transport system ATP-binding protein